MKKDAFNMSDNDDKPFECTAPGCGQRFANNDHLERHKQKHQLTLKFGALRGTDFSVADQTPTPTRFLRNCEEEGLFQDLDNPFDQDFKRATAPDQPSNSSSAHPTTSGQNSLPNSATPSQNVIVIEESETKVLPEPSTLPSSRVTTAIITAVSESKKSAISTPVSVVVRVPPHIPPAIPASIAAPDAQVPAALPVPSHIHGRANSTSSSMPIPSIPTPAIVTSPSASSPLSFLGSAKQRLKEQLKLHQQANSSNIIHRAMTEAVDMVTQQNGISSPGSHVNHSHHPTTTVANTSISAQDSKRGAGAAKRPRRTQEDMDPDERRRRFLERNRAAATRCREKRKIWVQQLEKKADDLSATNAHLQGEITHLRTEVAQLKSLLLAHKDCPVTIAQQRNAQLLNHQVAEQTNGVITSNSHGDPSSAEDVATSALTQMAHQATLELENLASTTMSSVSSAQGVITTNSNPIGV